MFNLSEQVRRLSATPKSRLTEKDGTAVKWKITAECEDKKYMWHITSVKEKSILWQNIWKYLCSI